MGRLGFAGDQRMMHRLQALLWDVDGTLADTEEAGHRPAFNTAFAEAGLPWHWNSTTYRRLLQVSGGRERIRAWMQEQGSQPEAAQPDPSAWINQLQQRKQHHYRQRLNQGLVPLRPGVERLLLEAHSAGVTQAVVTTSGRQAVEALLQRHQNLLACFTCWICGEDVEEKKPHPEAYRKAITRLGLDPAQALAIEDSPQGLRAARGADLKVVITTGDWHGTAEHLAEAALVQEHLDTSPTTLADLQALV